eukprot:scaffold19247_cov135-Isochrysis_galbana.AAC.6
MQRSFPLMAEEIALTDWTSEPKTEHLPMMMIDEIKAGIRDELDERSAAEGRACHEGWAISLGADIKVGASAGVTGERSLLLGRGVFFWGEEFSFGVLQASLPVATAPATPLPFRHRCLCHC